MRSRTTMVVVSKHSSTRRVITNPLVSLEDFSDEVQDHYGRGKWVLLIFTVDIEFPSKRGLQ